MVNNKSFLEYFQSDISRYSGGKISGFIRQFHYYLRKAQNSHGLAYKYYHARLKWHREKHGLEISDEVTIGKGLYIGHPWNITINNHSTIDNNCNIHKGVLIGEENRGKRKGSPSIGDCVWIGINAVIVGKIHIGNDVLIAPNSFVNRDVPSHSVVFGNPCRIIAKEEATESYINNLYCKGT